MRYRVEWDSVAESELAAIWLASLDRVAVSQAATMLERKLLIGPLEIGESRASSVQRIAFWPPIGIEYEVIEDDKRVVVQGVFQAG